MLACGVALFSNLMMSEKQCYIYAVRYEKERRRIQKVKARIYAGMSSKPEQDFLREEIIEMIDNDYVVETRIRITRDSYEPGAPVLTYMLNGERYIKTEANDNEEDNLGELETF